MHLNITSERYVPIIDEATAVAPDARSEAERRAAAGTWWAGMLSTMFEPPVRSA